MGKRCLALRQQGDTPEKARCQSGPSRADKPARFHIGLGAEGMLLSLGRILLPQSCHKTLPRVTGFFIRGSDSSIQATSCITQALPRGNLVLGSNLICLQCELSWMPPYLVWQGASLRVRWIGRKRIRGRLLRQRNCICAPPATRRQFRFVAGELVILILDLASPWASLHTARHSSVE